MSDEHKPMTVEELEAVRARAEAATPGPWSSLPIPGCDSHAVVNHERGQLRRVATVGSWDRFAENAAFIAEVREDVPRLLATIGQLRADVAADEWKPIEMAPEDEGLLQVWDAYAGLPVAARFDRARMLWFSEEIGRELAPTHFRRMPKSPFAPPVGGR